MSKSEITRAAQLIRPHLTSKLALCRVVYPPTHPDATIIAELASALIEFDRLVSAAMQSTNEQKHPEMSHES